MSTYIKGQPIEIRSDLTQAELVEFRKLVGLLGASGKETIEILKMPATYVHPSSSGVSFLASFGDAGRWYIPNFLLNTKPQSKEEQLINKIKYLNKRFLEQQLKKDLVSPRVKGA